MLNTLRRFFGLRMKLPSLLPWTGYVDGDDVVVEDVKATWFGGDKDPEDNGLTASGTSTKANPKILGCALPVICTIKGKRYLPTTSSPLAVDPRIPWFTPVEVTRGKTTVTLKLIDNGPNISRYPNNVIDLTPAAFEALGGDLDVGSMIVSFRIKGVARFFQQRLT